jgi:hypothetical protein
LRGVDCVSKLEVVGVRTASEVDTACSGDCDIVVSLDVMMVLEVSELDGEDVTLSPVSG